MATTLASLVVKIGADVTGVTAGMSTVEKRARMLKREFSSVTDSTLTWRGALSVLAGATGLALASAKVFELGAAVEETGSKFRTVFGPEVESAQKFLDEFASSAGLTMQKGQDLLATTAAIAQGMGMSRRSSAAFSEEIVRLAADLSSFNNIPIAQTSRAITSALTGEREALKTLGIVINDADVQARALADTGKATAAALTQQEKATATLALVTERAGVAVGDLGRTMDSPANRARALVAEVLTLRDSLAHALLPAFGVVLGELAKMAGAEGISGLSEKLSHSAQVIAAWAQFAVETFKTVALAIAAPVRIAFNLGEVIGKFLSAALFALSGNFSMARDEIMSLVTDMGQMGTAITDVAAGFDNMRVASGLAWQVVAGGATGESGGGTGAAPALELVAIGARNVTSALVTAQPVINTYADGLQSLATNADTAATATNRLADAQRGLSGVMGLLGAFGVALPFLGQASGILSAINSFGGGFASGGTIPAGQWGIVGERGPEIVSGPAHVTPTGGGMGGIVVNVAPARDPISFARDRQWIRALEESVEVMKHNGVRFAT